MPDETRFQADAADIRSLLAGTDPATRLPGTAVGARLVRMRDEILSSDVPARRQQKSWLASHWPRGRAFGGRRPRTVVIYATIPVLIAVTGAAWAITSNHTPSGLLSCYSAPNLRAPMIALGKISNDQTTIGFCAHEWAIGALGNPHSHTVPPLVACVVRDTVGVFPRTTCARLGLQPMSARYLRADRAVAAVTAELQNRLRFFSVCVHQRQAVAIARQALARHGFASWNLKIESRFDVTGARLDPATSCVIAMIYPGRHLVELALYPGPHTAWARFWAAFGHLGGRSCKPGSKPACRGRPRACLAQPKKTSASA